MRKGLALVISLMVMTVFISKGSTETFEINFSKSEFIFKKQKDNSVQIIPQKIEYQFDPTPGTLGLPMKAVNIILPANAVGITGTLTPVSKVLIYSGVTVAQAPEAIPTYENVLSDSERTSTNNSTQPNPISLATTNNFRHSTVAYFHVNPFEYDSQTKSLYLVTSFAFTLSYNTSSAKITSDFYNPELCEAVSKIANTSTPLNTYEFSEYKDQANVTMKPDRVDYAIITSSALKDSFKTLQIWKNIKGVRTKIYCIEDINKYYAGNSIQEKIKRYIESLSKNHGLKYVLLGGDDTVVPTRLCKASCGDYEDYIPSDLYYVCFNGNFSWDGNNNGIYGEPEDSVDFNSSVFISRLPVRTSKQVKDYSERVCLYEMCVGDKTFNRNILMSGNHLFNPIASNSNSDAFKKGEKLYSEFIEPYWDGKRVRYFDTYTDFSTGSAYDLTRENLQEQLAKGYSFFDIMTHGSNTGWSMESGYSYDSAFGSTLNNNSFTHITTMACHTNAFDSDSDPCLSESLIRNPLSGVLSYLGSSRYGWGTKTEDQLGVSLKYEAEYYKNLFDPSNKYKNFAKLVYTAKNMRLPFCGYNGADRWIQLSLNAIGDPEMPVLIDNYNEFSGENVGVEKGLLVVSTGNTRADISVQSTKDYGETYSETVRNTGNEAFENGMEDVIVCISKYGYKPSLFHVSYSDGKAVVKRGLPNYSDLHPNMDEDEMLSISENQDNSHLRVIIDSQNVKIETLIAEENNLAGNWHVIVSDVVGNIKLSEHISIPGLHEISLPNLERGIYIVSLSNSKYIMDTKRIVIR